MQYFFFAFCLEHNLIWFVSLVAPSLTAIAKEMGKTVFVNKIIVSKRCSSQTMDFHAGYVRCPIKTAKSHEASFNKQKVHCSMLK